MTIHPQQSDSSDLSRRNSDTIVLPNPDSVSSNGKVYEYVDQAEKVRKSPHITARKQPVRLIPRPTPGWKRTVDIAGALFLLIALSPLFLCVAVLIKLGSRGAVFFRQGRVGFMGESFRIWKFRTMHTNVDEDVHEKYVAQLATNDGSRLSKLRAQKLIPGGKLLRRLAIDELPQLFNVLAGDMSLVGPRPDVVPFANYGDQQKRRFEIVPGMTGYWQVNGKNETTFDEMCQLDLYYVKNRSLTLDAYVLIMTIPAIVSQQDGEE